MFQFTGFPSYGYVFTIGYIRFAVCGFPHSDISGSTPACGSPKLFAAYHVLHRFLVPRHPPYAFYNLTVLLKENSKDKKITFTHLDLHLNTSVCFCFFAWMILIEFSKNNNASDQKNDLSKQNMTVSFLPRKEVIQPHLPIRLPCYDFTPVIGFALGKLFIVQLWAPPTSMV